MATTKVKEHNLEIKKEKKPIWKKLFKYLAIIFGIFSIVLILFFFSILFGFWGKLPTEYELKKVKLPIASEVYANDGSLLGKYYLENRSFTKFDEISTYTIQALVATEDHRFFKHKGIDAKSYLRVILKNIIGGNRSAGGGSTISQQVIKNLYKRQSFGFLSLPINKIKEAILAQRLERVYSKEDIITLYLNTVSFGELAFGIETAAQRFFSKPALQLNLHESATLIGLLKATGFYSPRKNPKNSKKRRNTVLALMEKHSFISPSSSKNAQAKELNLKYNRAYNTDGLATHFRNVLKNDLQEWANANPLSSGEVYNIYTDGLKIYTTIDSKMQKFAEAAVKKQMKSLHSKFLNDWNKTAFVQEHYEAIESAKRKSKLYQNLKAKNKSEREIDEIFSIKKSIKLFTWEGLKDVNISPRDSIIHYLQMLNAGFVAMEPNTGEIKSWVGGIDISYFPEDKVTTARQVGSTFKPFTYTTAIMQGISPCKLYKNELRKYTNWQDWTPKNAGEEFYNGFYSLQGALAKSVNTVAAQVIFEVGIDNVIDLAKSMGIVSNLPQVPSITLGTADITPLEMATAYSTFANGGYATEPFYLKKITNANGTELATFNNKQKVLRNRILDYNTTTMMQNILKKVVDEGTGKRLRWFFGLRNDIAGKTGTTQDQGDGWFMGFTPNLVTATWVGSEDRRVHFRTLTEGQGSRTALPIFGEFLKNLVNDGGYSNFLNSFEEPDFVQQTQLDCELYIDELPRKPVFANNDAKRKSSLQNNFKLNKNFKLNEEKINETLRDLNIPVEFETKKNNNGTTKSVAIKTAKRRYPTKMKKEKKVNNFFKKLFGKKNKKR